MEAGVERVESGVSGRRARIHRFGHPGLVDRVGRPGPIGAFTGGVDGQCELPPAVRGRVAVEAVAEENVARFLRCGFPRAVCAVVRVVRALEGDAESRAFPFDGEADSRRVGVLTGASVVEYSAWLSPV